MMRIAPQSIVMKTLLGFSLLALVAVDAAGVCASAQTYPTRRVIFVVPFCARRRHRIPGAAAGTKARAAARQAVRDRESARRRRSDRGALRRPRRARWLYHSHGAFSGHGYQRRLAQEAPL